MGNKRVFDWDNLDKIVDEYFSWCANWSELRDWERAYLKAIAIRLHYAELLDE